MADNQDRATAGVPAEPTEGDAEPEAIGLDEVDEASLTESEKVAKAAAGARPVRKSVEPPTGKGHATRKRPEVGEHEHTRSNPVQFVREVISELKKVVWPTGDQLRQYFVVVLVFVLIMIAYVSLLDLGLGAAMLKLLGKGSE